MDKPQRDEKKIDELLQLFERIEKSDIEDNRMFDFNITVPYSGGKKPDPARWEDKGLKHILP